jgi:hypothetical protein
MKLLVILAILQVLPLRQGPYYLPHGWVSMVGPGDQAKHLDPDCVYTNNTDREVTVRLEITGNSCRYVVIKIE